MIKEDGYSARFKARVAIDALRGSQDAVEIAQRYDVHPDQVHEWKTRVLREAEKLFSVGHYQGDVGSKEKIRELHAKIGQLTMERDFLARALGRNR